MCDGGSGVALGLPQCHTAFLKERFPNRKECGMNVAWGNVYKLTAAFVLAIVVVLCLPFTAWASESSTSLQMGTIASGEMTLETQTLSAHGGGTTTYAGDTMYETAVAQAKAAYPKGASIAVIAGPGDAWVDALSAAGLAGAIDGPILFSNANTMNTASLKALKDLGVKEVIIVGGPLAVGSGVEKDLEKANITVKKRLYGSDCYGTNLAIYNYGLENKLWKPDLTILATGTWFGDALSVSPIAFAKHAPIILADDKLKPNSKLSAAWKAGASAGIGKTVVVVGGPYVVSQSAVDYAGTMSKLAGGSGTAKWLYGDTQYETSLEIAKWAVSAQGFSWNNVAYTTGAQPYDALAGSVLQGKTKSVMLLADSAAASTISGVADNKKAITHVRFFGGNLAMPAVVRTAVTSALSDHVRYESTGISYSKMLTLEVSNISYYSSSETSLSMDPANTSYGESGFYQFAVLNGGYSGKVTASQLDAFIATYGSDGMLAGHGQDFIDAAKRYNVNEVYLLAHAILESGWGKSALARGTTIDGVTYYNFYGIGAYDSDALGGGSRTAGKYGWDSPRATILGAAKWISDNYLGNAYSQNTLYKMRWNYSQAAREGVVWKQYATGREWATSIARVMSNCYDYCGYNMDTCGLTFLVPQYS